MVRGLAYFVGKCRMASSETVSLTLDAASWRSMFELIYEPTGHCL